MAVHHTGWKLSHDCGNFAVPQPKNILYFKSLASYVTEGDLSQNDIHKRVQY